MACRVPLVWLTFLLGVGESHCKLEDFTSNGETLPKIWENIYNLRVHHLEQYFTFHCFYETVHRACVSYEISCAWNVLFLNKRIFQNIEKSNQINVWMMSRSFEI